MAIGNVIFESEAYDRYMVPALFRPYAAEIVARMESQLRGPVIETACGTGALTELLRSHLPKEIPLVATDLSSDMLNYAKDRLGSAKVDWQVADAADLPFGDGTFSAVLCQFGLMFVPDRAAAVSEAHRVLQRDGLFLFAVWDSIETNPVGQAVDEARRTLFPSESTSNSPGPYSLSSQTEIRRLLTHANFVRVTIDQVKLPLRSPSVDWLAKGFVEGTPMLASIRKKGIDPNDVVEAIATRLRSIGGPDVFNSSMQALVVKAYASG